MNMEMLYSSLALLAITFFLYKIIFHSNHKTKNHPPSPPSLPIIGHLHLLKPPFHHTFHTLAQKYGPIFALRLGRKPILVISSPSAAKQCFTQNDIVFANRPKLLITQHLAYNNSLLVWAPYGPHWRNLRRLATLTALSHKQIDVAYPGRRAEIRTTVRALLPSSEGEEKKVNLTQVFEKLARNLLMRVVFGEVKETKTINNVSIPLMTACDFFPVLRWVGYKGIEKEMIRMNKERDEELQSWVDEAKAIRRTGGGHTTSEKFVVDKVLELQEMDPEYYTDEVVKGIILVLIIAGSETTAKTLEWAMSNLINHPEILEKGTKEIEEKIGKGRIVDDCDLPKLNYIQHIIYETLRLFPPAPLLVPHYSSEDCTIEGYHVSKGTILFINAWTLHRDPNIWEEPMKFIPERFEKEKEGFMYMPFGIGRRMCPGNNFALHNVGLVLATLIQCFDWSSIGPGLVDLSDQTGVIITPKKEPLLVKCNPRYSMDIVLSQI